MPSVSCSDLSFHRPDGTPVLSDLDLALGPGRSGLVGRNGAGKTTLLRIIAGALAPAGGSVRVDGRLGYLPQHLALQADARVDEVLGIAGTRAALRDIEAGVVDEERLAQVGDDWDVEERARATLDRVGLGGIDLDRTVRTLSGGEATLVGLAARFLARPGVLLLDEPTNNLDLAHRRHLSEAIAGFEGVLLVVSHDRALLDRVHRIIELREGAATVYGGNLDAYEEAVAREPRPPRGRPAGSGAGRLPGRRARRQPRPSLPARHRHRPVAAPRPGGPHRGPGGLRAAMTSTSGRGLKGWTTHRLTEGTNPMQHRIVPNLWFDTRAEEAARFYVSVFANSRIVDVTRYTEVGPGPAGTVVTVDFELDGQPFVGINGGPHFTFDEAVSFQISCETQDEVDYYWDRLTDGGEEGQCGWLKDRYGLSWQVVPTVLEELIKDPDAGRAQRATEAMLAMRKLDIAALRNAADGVPAT